MNEAAKRITTIQFEGASQRPTTDVVAVEEPLEIRVVTGPPEQRREKSLSITMRTPGHDFELAAGFLLTEGIISSHQQIESIAHCGVVTAGREKPNIVRVELTEGTLIDYQKLQRHFYTTSSCGICGKASLEALDRLEFPPLDSSATVARNIIFDLPNKLRCNQSLFQTTGGAHAAGLFEFDGELVGIHEDIGRHNALDKLIGQRLLAGNHKSPTTIVAVSGRASFELLQKALAASIPVLVAVGAPSSLSIELAERFNITLIGFTSNTRFNVYTHSQRVC